MAILGVNAIAGNSASPSLAIAFPINPANGIIPWRYSVVTSIWGPHPGMNPINTANNGIYNHAACAITARSRPKNA